MATLANSAIVNVDVTSASKTITLPPAKDNIGKSFFIRDSTGTAGSPNSISIQPSGSDTIDGSTSTVSIAEAYGSFSFIAQSATNYSILAIGVNNTWVPSGGGGGGGGGGTGT